MVVDSKTKSVHFVEHFQRDMDGGSMYVLAYDTWEQHMQERGYVVTPLIERSGACVSVNIGTTDQPEHVLGCLVKNPETGTLFHHPTLCYQALVKADNTVSHIFFTEVLRSLQPVGSIMYLDMQVIEDERFASQPSSQGKYLTTRLNVPNLTEPEPGKLYVTASYKKRGPRGKTEPTVAVTFPVNPWDVIQKDMFPTEWHDRIVKHLQ